MVNNNYNRSYIMVELLLGAFVGALIGWSMPQPAWAAALIAKIKKVLHIGS
jgi:uncharacterized membrane protein